MNPKRFYTIAFYDPQIIGLQQKVDEELYMLQQDDNEIIDVQYLAREKNLYAIIKYKS